jgi:signal transduction histidine kinase
VSRIAFLGHALLWACVLLLLLVIAGGFVAAVVGLSWGILLAAHGFFFVVAPVLSQRWVEREVEGRLKVTVTEERRVLEGRHARSLEALSASMAHEIRSPITAARSLTQQIAEDPTSPANAEYARVATAELDRVERSVSHLLRYAREEPLRPREMDLGDAVSSALETLHDRIERSPASVKPEFTGALPLSGDPEKLRRVVINLVTNALEALEESGFPEPTVTLTAGETPSSGEVWLRVADNGPGIEPDQLEKVFDPFHTSKSEGTGLGLAITRKLVEAHGGTLGVESKLGAGATFVVTLPRVGPSGDAGP